MYKTAQEMRKKAETTQKANAFDYFYNTLEKKIFERIEADADIGNVSLTIGFNDELNREDKWMDNPHILAMVKVELEQRGYKYAYHSDRDMDWITITW